MAKTNFTDHPLMTLFYLILAWAYARVFGGQQMLHYPLFREPGQGLLEGQRHFTDLCVERLGVLTGRDLLEIGCGNGEQAIYVHGRYRPKSTRGIDLHAPHVNHANRLVQLQGLQNIIFALDDAQWLGSVSDASVDALICIESAHHYPDKAAFLAQVHRVLRPGGRFLIAELLQLVERRPSLLDRGKSTYYWTLDQYRAALAAVELEVSETEDISDRLLAGFATSSTWFMGTARGPAAWAGRLLGRALVAYYSWQLRSARRYWLLAGSRL